MKNEIDTPESVQIKRPHNKSSEEDGSSPQKIVKQMSVFKPACRADYEETIKWIKDCDKDLKSIQITVSQLFNTIGDLLLFLNQLFLLRFCFEYSKYTR